MNGSKNLFVSHLMYVKLLYTVEVNYDVVISFVGYYADRKSVKNAIRGTKNTISECSLRIAHELITPDFRLRWIPRARMQRDAITSLEGPSLSSIEIT